MPFSRILHALADSSCRLSTPKSPYVHKPHQIHVCLGWCCLWLKNISFMKLRCLWRCFLMLADANSAQSKHTRYDRCEQYLANTLYRWSMSITQSAQDFVDCAYHCSKSMSLNQMHIAHRLYIHALDDFAYRSPTLVERCTQTKSDDRRPWLMVPAISRRYIDKTCKWKLMLPNWCTYSLTHVCMTWLMFLSICRYRLATVRRLGLISISRWTHVRSNTCRPLLILPVIF